MGFVEILPLDQKDPKWPKLLSFSTGYVIDFKLEILCTGLM